MMGGSSKEKGLCDTGECGCWAGVYIMVKKGGGGVIDVCIHIAVSF